MQRLRWSARLTLLTAVLNTLHLGAQAHLSGGGGGGARMSAVANTVNSAEVVSERRVVQLENTLLLAENSRRIHSDSAARSEVTELTAQCNTESIKYHKY